MYIAAQVLPEPLADYWTAAGTLLAFYWPVTDPLFALYNRPFVRLIYHKNKDCMLAETNRQIFQFTIRFEY